MAHDTKEWLDYLRKRWTRHDARLWLRHDHARFLPPGSQSQELKFDPEQPRVPVGNPDGGRWVAGGEGNEATAVPSGGIESLPLRISSTREAECLELQRNDTFICNAVGTASCWRQAAFRFSQCLRGAYVPPFYF